MEENEGDEDLLHMANELLIRFGRKPYVKDLSGCDHGYFVDVYEAMVGDPLSGVVISDAVEDMVQNVQIVLNSLSSDVLGIDISHVNAEMIVKKDREHIRCLLEIFNGLLEFILEELNQDVEMELQEASCHGAADNSIDSNRLDDSHEILSDVLQEEFGHSYQKKVTAVQVPLPNHLYEKDRFTKPCELGDKITWKSGENNHTVSWADAGVRSPSGESTATDDLICLSQSTGNSTDELIREAQTVQRELNASRSSIVQSKESKPKFDDSAPFTSQWSTILSTTSIADHVTEMEDLQLPKKSAFIKEKSEVLKRPRKPMQYGHTDYQRSSNNISTQSEPSIDFHKLPPQEISADSLQVTGKIDTTYSIASDSTSIKDVSDQETPPRKHPKKFTKNSKKIPAKETKTKQKPIKQSVSRRKKTSLQDWGNKKPTVHNGEKDSIHNGGITQVSIMKNEGGSTKASEPDVKKLQAPQNSGSNGVPILKGSKSLADGKERSESDTQKTDPEHDIYGKKNKAMEGASLPSDEKELDMPCDEKEALKDSELPKLDNIEAAKVVLVPESVNENSEMAHDFDDKTREEPHNVANDTENDIVIDSIVVDEKPEESNVKAKVQTNLEISKNTTDSRSQQLFELSERLKKLREQVQPSITLSTNTIDNTTCQSNIPSANTSRQTNVLLADSTRQSNIVNKEKKEKAKVSFNFDSLLDEYHYSMSDTEVDYASPMVETKSLGQKGTLRDKANRHVERGRKRTRKGRESPHRSILRTSRLINSSTSYDDDDDDDSSRDNLSSRFEKPFLKRDERLRKLKKGLRAEEKENELDVRQLRQGYSKHHGKLRNQEKTVKRQSNILAKEKKAKEKIIEQFDVRSPRLVSPRLRKCPVDKYAAKLTAIYGSPRKTPSSDAKGTKRSASTSPVARRRYKTPLVLEEDEILPIMEDEFPFIHLSPHTAKLMWQRQLRQINNLSKHTKPHKTTKIQRTIEEAQRKQKALADVMKKEIEHNRRLKELKERKDEDTVVRRNLHERRQRSARARRYYDEYTVRNKARMLKKRTKEEKIFKQLFEDGLEIQKQRIKEMRDYAREQKEKNAKRQQNEIESLENFYRDKFSCLAESVAQEKYDLEIRQKAQAQVLDKMRRGMRKRMEQDLKDIQEQLQNDDDAYYFRQLDADVLKKEFQLATYKASKYR